jgi:hypothetical protein
MNKTPSSSPRIRQKALAAALGAMVALPASAMEALLTADAYVSAANPGKNFGVAGDLIAGKGHQALLNFDLSALPSDLAFDQVARATLYLWVSRVKTAGSLQFAATNPGWAESSVSRNNVPAAGLPFATVPITTGQGWIAIDLTDEVRSRLAQPGSGLSLIVAAGAGAADTLAFFDSKENRRTSHPARLEIALNQSAGMKGDPGATGPQGAAGPAGPQGSAGPQGLPGLQGPQGPEGPQGPAGPEGLPGPQGPEGAVGPAGLSGRTLLNGTGSPTDELGSDGDFFIDTVAKQLFGPKLNGNWNAFPPVSLVGPQGPAGQEGPAGAMGPQGPAGPEGPIGPQGSAGAQGAVGLQGPVGPAGAIGPQGPAGAMGPQGPTGPEGPEGPAGAVGPEGLQGPAGPQGPQGAPGPSTAFVLGHSGGTALSNGTRYIGLANVSNTENSVKIALTPLNGTTLKLSDLAVNLEKAPGNNAGAGYAFTVRANGNETQLTCSIQGSSAVLCADTDQNHLSEITPLNGNPVTLSLKSVGNGSLANNNSVTSWSVTVR